MFITCSGGGTRRAFVHWVVCWASDQYRSKAACIHARSKGWLPRSRTLARYDAAHLLALLDPCPVIGSLATTTSAIPSTRPPEGSSPTGCRTTGGEPPHSRRPASG